MTGRIFRTAFTSAAFAAPLLLGACAVGPNYHHPTLPTSAGYERPAASDAAGEGAPRLVSGQDVAADWWRVFGSKDLDALVETALKNNPTLTAAKASLRAAHEQVLAQRGAYYPTASLSIQPTRSQFAPTLSSPLENNSFLYTLTTTQLNISYVPDLFGANRRTVESLVAEQDAQRFELEAARLTIATNVVTAAVQDALLRAQIAQTHAIIADQERTLVSFRRQLELGQASRADVAAQEALLAQAQQTLPPLEKQLKINQDLLASLVGRTPAELDETQFDLAAITLPQDLPLSLPARLVAQRPDVRIAEAQLHAASAQIGIAEAARWPNLELDASGGSATLALGVSLANSATFWNLAATLTQPIFEGGQLMHKKRAAVDAYDQAAAQYQATVVGAFQNTADALHALRADAAADLAADNAAQASAKSLQIARRQLELGDVNQLTVLAAEQTYAQARIAALQARANRYSDAAGLFQALGGGWWNRCQAKSVKGIVACP
jgi:NodT family efflux transporter outer membrane factor (OMF) lipoprotein